MGVPECVCVCACVCMTVSVRVRVGVPVCVCMRTRKAHPLGIEDFLVSLKKPLDIKSKSCSPPKWPASKRGRERERGEVRLRERERKREIDR